MNRNYTHQTCGKRSKCLPDGSIGLVDPQYFTLFALVDIVSDDRVKHGVTQTVEQPVYAKTYSKRDDHGSKTGKQHSCETQDAGEQQDY